MRPKGFKAFHSAAEKPSAPHQGSSMERRRLFRGFQTIFQHPDTRKHASSRQQPLSWLLLASLTFTPLALQQRPHAPPPRPHLSSCFHSIRAGKRRREGEGTAERGRPVTICHFFLTEREGPNCFSSSQTDPSYRVSFFQPVKFGPVCMRNPRDARRGWHSWRTENTQREHEQQEGRGPFITPGLNELTVGRLEISGRARATSFSGRALTNLPTGISHS